MKDTFKIDSAISPAPNDLNMPCLGLGTWLSEPGDVGRSVHSAISNGYRLIDCASIYENEAEIGEALKKIFSQGQIKREDLWLTGKLWNDCHAEKDVRPACQQTLTDLGVDYLDLYLIHFPVSFVHGVKEPTLTSQMTNIALEETWSEMEKLVDDGLVKHIGVSNFEIDEVRRVQRSARIMPKVNQFECHPRFSRRDLVEYCQRNNIAVTAHTSLGSPANNLHNNERLMQNELVVNIGKKYKKSGAQVLLRWGLQLGQSLIPKSNKEVRLVENGNIFDFNLTEEDMNLLGGLNISLRYNHPETAWLGRAKFSDQ